MYQLSLNNNQLKGEIDLARLPNKMTELWLNNNQITGEVDLTHLPGGMKELYLSNNQLSGTLVIKKLPQSMIGIYARGNHFNAVAVVESKATDVDIYLQNSGVTAVVDENGNANEKGVHLSEAPSYHSSLLGWLCPKFA